MSNHLKNAFMTLLQGKRSKARVIPFVVILVTALLMVMLKAAQPEPPVKAKEEKSGTVQAQWLAGGAKSPGWNFMAVSNHLILLQSRQSSMPM